MVRLVRRDLASPEGRADRTLMYYLYILVNLKGSKTYVGITDDIDRRIKDHNEGKSKFTSTFGPWKLMYSEEIESYNKARKRERYFKSGAGRKKIKQIINQ